CGIQHMSRKFFKRSYLKITNWLNPFIDPILETCNLTIPLGILALVCFLLWKKNIPGFADFGLNAFTEILGIILTVVFVDQLIRQQELRRTLPLQAAAYEDVRMLTTRIIQFWESAFRQAVPYPASKELIQFWEIVCKQPVSQLVPLTVNQLLSLETINTIRTYLDLDSQPSVAPPRTWWEWLPQQEQEFRTRAERILERHMGILDPQAYALVHQLVSGSGLLHPDTGMQLIRVMKQYDQEEGFPRPHNLASYWATNTEALNTVIQLNEWCIKKKQFLENQGISGLLNPTLTINTFDENQSPKCMIDPNKFFQQVLAVNAYREQLAKQIQQSSEGV
ncbi:MAG: hypothetical protein KAF91_32290, partial [Nostoc sp. TH1S01]|nr:hypothetical protein [Nostoc sp. TH1S01]